MPTTLKLILGVPSNLKKKKVVSFYPNMLAKVISEALFGFSLQTKYALQSMCEWGALGDER